MTVFIASVAMILMAIALARFGIALLRVDQLEAEKNASRFQSWKDAFLGRAQVHNDWLPDARVQGGMVYNKDKNRIEVCGRLSDESIDRTFR